MAKKLPKWLEDVEVLVDKAMPFMLILLTIIIAGEFFHWWEHVHDFIYTLDNFIIAFFIIDLCFKWHRTQSVRKFFKLYWIDIIAVFPFYALFRLYEFFALEQTQKVLHEAVIVRETRLLRELEAMKIAETARFARQGRLIRIIANGLRLLRARWYVMHGYLVQAAKDKRHFDKQH